MEEATHTSRAAPAVVKISAGLDCEAVSPPGFRSDARICKFHAADHGVNARVMPPREFGVAAGFCVFQLWVQEGTAASALSATHPDSVAESLLHAHVQVVEPFVGDLRVAQVFDSRHLLPRSFGEECVLQTPESSPIS